MLLYFYFTLLYLLVWYSHVVGGRRSGGTRAAEDAEQVPAAACTLVRHLWLRDDEMREHDNGVRGEEPQARPELHTRRKRAGLHVQDQVRRRRSDNAGRRRRLHRRQVGFRSSVTDPLHYITLEPI